VGWEPAARGALELLDEVSDWLEAAIETTRPLAVDLSPRS